MTTDRFTKQPHTENMKISLDHGQINLRKQNNFAKGPLRTVNNFSYACITTPLSSRPVGHLAGAESMTEQPWCPNPEFDVGLGPLQRLCSDHQGKAPRLRPGAQAYTVSKGPKERLIGQHTEDKALNGPTRHGVGIYSAYSSPSEFISSPSRR